ncbi:MAG: PilN domain-containing protein [Phycisphaerales bacterium]
MPMRAWNLLSPDERRRQRLRRRARRWRAALAGYACISAGLIALGVGNASHPHSAAADGLRLRIAAIESEIALLHAEHASLAPQLEVAAALRERPEWRLLLEAFDSSLDQSIVLQRCAVQPAGQDGLDGARAAGFTIDLSGYAPDALAATTLTLDIESLGVFTEVTLIEAKRATVLARDAVEFRVRCRLAPSAEVAR